MGYDQWWVRCAHLSTCCSPPPSEGSTCWERCCCAPPPPPCSWYKVAHGGARSEVWSCCSVPLPNPHCLLAQGAGCDHRVRAVTRAGAAPAMSTWQAACSQALLTFITLLACGVGSVWREGIHHAPTWPPLNYKEYTVPQARTFDICFFCNSVWMRAFFAI